MEDFQSIYKFLTFIKILSRGNFRQYNHWPFHIFCVLQTSQFCILTAQLRVYKQPLF